MPPDGKGALLYQKCPFQNDPEGLLRKIPWELIKKPEAGSRLN